jgi:hypothetical protein
MKISKHLTIYMKLSCILGPFKNNIRYNNMKTYCTRVLDVFLSKVLICEELCVLSH